MPTIETTDERLVLRTGSIFNQVTLTLDKTEGKVRLDRTMLMWQRRPVELGLSDIDDVAVIAVKDAASGARMHVPTPHMCTGETVPLPVEDAAAEKTAHELRDFLGLRPH